MLTVVVNIRCNLVEYVTRSVCAEISVGSAVAYQRKSYHYFYIRGLGHAEVEDTAQHGVAESTVHADACELGQHLMAWVFAPQPNGIGQYGLLSPNIIIGLEYILTVSSNTESMLPKQSEKEI